MKSFRLEKTSGDADVTHEAIIWAAVLFFIVAPLMFVFYLFVGSLWG